MHSLAVFGLFMAGFLASVFPWGLLGFKDPIRSRVALVFAPFFGVPALVSLVPIVKDGHRSATTGELALLAVYTFILAVAVSGQSRRFKDASH